MSDLDRLKSHVTDAVDRMAEDLWSLALQIHANPELAFKEEKAASWLTAFSSARGAASSAGWAGCRPRSARRSPAPATGRRSP